MSLKGVGHVKAKISSKAPSRFSLSFQSLALRCSIFLMLLLPLSLTCKGPKFAAQNPSAEVLAS